MSAREKPPAVTLTPAGIEFESAPGEPLLESARRAGVAVRSACRNGVCEICAGVLQSGQARDLRHDRTLVPGQPVLLCRAAAIGDLVIQSEDVVAAGEYGVEDVTATLVELTPLNHDIYRVGLRLPPGRTVKFHAGQYLAIALPGEEPAWFSIASAPGAELIELHIQAGEDWATAQAILEYLRRERRAPLQLPFGRACLASRPRHKLLLVAAGTGFAQMKSILDYLAAVDQQNPVPSPPVVLYWGVRQTQDLYLPDEPGRWLAANTDFRFVPVVSDDPESDWQGHHDRLVEAVLADGHDLRELEVIASGSPTMVYTLMDALLAAGLPESAFHSDVLEYAPR